MAQEKDQLSLGGEIAVPKRSQRLPEYGMVGLAWGGD
jgi:hypothetical protein